MHSYIVTTSHRSNVRLFTTLCHLYRTWARTLRCLVWLYLSGVLPLVLPVLSFMQLRHGRGNGVITSGWSTAYSPHGWYCLCIAMYCRYGSDVMPLVKKLNVDQDFAKAVQYVFGKTLLCKNSDVALQASAVPVPVAFDRCSCEGLA
jgi:SMC proteins Flexible Hinge Domain